MSLFLGGHPRAFSGRVTTFSIGSLACDLTIVARQRTTVIA
jgi:hypothetical protein